MKRLISISLAILACAGIANAETYTVGQKNIKFSQPIITIKPGDSIKFVNKDNVTHNVVSTTKGLEFDLGKFKPGMERVVSFDKYGTADVECTIHPNMKMTVFVYKPYTAN